MKTIDELLAQTNKENKKNKSKHVTKINDCGIANLPGNRRMDIFTYNPLSDLHFYETYFKTIDVGENVITNQDIYNIIIALNKLILEEIVKDGVELPGSMGCLKIVGKKQSGVNRFASSKNNRKIAFNNFNTGGYVFLSIFLPSVHTKEHLQLKSFKLWQFKSAIKLKRRIFEKIKANEYYKWEKYSHLSKAFK